MYTHAHTHSTWPSVYQLAAWTGNGLYGVTAMVDQGGQSLRFDVARTDVYNCGAMPRMSIGSLRPVHPLACFPCFPCRWCTKHVSSKAPHDSNS